MSCVGTERCRDLFAEVEQDTVDDFRLGDEGDDTQGAATWAQERVELEYLSEQAGPGSSVCLLRWPIEGLVSRVVLACWPWGRPMTAGVGAKVTYGILPGVGNLCGDGVNPLQDVEPSLYVTVARVGWRGDSHLSRVELRHAVKPNRGSGYVTCEPLEALAVIGLDELVGVQGKARG